MLSGETVGPNPTLILWDLIEGKRAVTVQPPFASIVAAAFSSSGSIIAVVGLDSHHRFQIILLDVLAMRSQKGTINIAKLSAPAGASSSPSPLICRQISDFDISQIRFCPWDETTLVSCGRENVRFWRMRKGHLPGRPVPLNEYTRGFVFSALAFYADQGFISDGSAPEGTGGVRGDQRDFLHKGAFVFVGCNKGLLLKINFTTEQVLCAYQLHQPNIAICALCIHSGYAVTGGADSKLRIWYGYTTFLPSDGLLHPRTMARPMDFNDFLLESQHEGPVTNIRISSDGRKQAIGTSAGTLGLLNVSEHR
jgi:WD40 repeat protein